MSLGALSNVETVGESSKAVMVGLEGVKLSQGLGSAERKQIKPESSRLNTLKSSAPSESASPSSSRQSSPGGAGAGGTPTAAAEGRIGGAKRKDDGWRSLPRNVDQVFFGDFEIKTWYHSPYPLSEEEIAGPSTSINGHGRAVAAARAQAGNKTNAAARPSPSTPADRGTPPATATSSAMGRTDSAERKPRIASLWICEGCFKYMRTYPGWNAHRRECPHRHPPGRKVYQRGSHTIWEVDGSLQKLYCQNLSLFGKLFIDHKTIFFDVEPFLFYVVTDTSANFDYVLGYFSKEKLSYDDYNLACIITFPPFQKKGFGTLMIEFSYYLSAKAGSQGTPERPLSELGFKGYVSFWSAVLLRTLALAFDEDEADVSDKLLPVPLTSPSKNASAAVQAASNHPASASAHRAQRKAAVRIRSLLLGIDSRTCNTSPDGKRPSALEAKGSDADTDDTDMTEDEILELRKARRAALGFGKELPPGLAVRLAALEKKFEKSSSTGSASLGQGRRAKKAKRETDDEVDGSAASDPEPASLEIEDDADAETNVSSQRPRRLRRHGASNATTHSTSNGASAAAKPALHPYLSLVPSSASARFSIATTLERIAEAANLRPEDAAFAMSECGLLKWGLGDISEGKLPEGVVTKDKIMQQGKTHQINGSSLPASDSSSSSSSSSSSVEIPSTSTGPPTTILLTRQAVRSALVSRGVKRPVLDLAYVFV